MEEARKTSNIVKWPDKIIRRTLVWGKQKLCFVTKKTIFLRYKDDKHLHTCTNIMVTHLPVGKGDLY